MNIQDYKCPNCTGRLPFDSVTGKMKCPYCEAEFEAEALNEWNKTLESAGAEKTEWGNYDDTGARDWNPGELDGLDSNECPSCGAAIVGDKNTIATCCPYCGNTQIVKTQVAGVLKPNYVLPFKKDKAAAVKALETFQKGKFLLPSSFKSGNRIEKIQAIYVPFWLFDCDIKGKIDFKATKVTSWSSGNTTYTKTDTYLCTREGEMAFEKIPADGSERMDDDLMNSIEPYDFSALTDFNPAYLSGFLAEKYDIDAEKSKERINTRIRNSVEQIFRQDVTGYTSVQKQSSVINVEHGKVHYALLPVWIVSSVYKSKNYIFAMNGQSGKLTGALPVCAKKAAIMITSFFAAFTAVFSAVIHFFF